MTSPNLDTAISHWQGLLGKSNVNADDKNLGTLTVNCLGFNRQVSAILYPDSSQNIKKIVEIANEYQIPIYPFSTGKNWGYGSINPAVDNCVLVDLSRLNKILDFEPETGILTVEPGVTQRQLDQFLKQNKYPYLIPVTGAGPDCSLVGNALERGYGITPHADHFGAVMDLEAVLPNGEVYRSMLGRLGGDAVDKAFKWGMGPYIDGLFSQSNFGIVTQMTIALAPKPKCVEAFFFSVKKPEDLERAVVKIRQVLKEVGSVTGSINLMNKHRVLSMSEPYPVDHIGADGLITDKELRKMMRRNQVMEWTGVGAIYGTKRVVAATRAEIRRILRPVASRLIFFTPGMVKNLYGLAHALPGIRNLHLVNVLATLNKTMQLFAGEPSEIALPLAYWRSGKMPEDNTPMNPDKDGCGLIWYSPLLAMKPDLTRQYTEMVTSICIKHRIEPLITLTSISDRCWDSTVPILFDRSNPEEVERAHACYHELLDTGRKHGFVPYRLGIQSMTLPAEENAVPNILKKFKQAIDEHNILAPGRYGL